MTASSSGGGGHWGAQQTQRWRLQQRQGSSSSSSHGSSQGVVDAAVRSSVIVVALEFYPSWCMRILVCTALHASLTCAVFTGRLDAEVLSVTRRVGELLQKLPRDINPVNLEELRRIKQALVELENKVRPEHV